MSHTIATTVIMQLEPVGQPRAIKEARKVVFVDLLGAAAVRPKGYAMVLGGHLLFGVVGPILTRHATGLLPATALYIAATSEDFRILSHPAFSLPFEIGRWKNHTYMASISERGPFLSLHLQLERLGRVQLVGGLRAFSDQVRPVFDLVVNRAAGPVM